MHKRLALVLLGLLALGVIPALAQADTYTDPAERFTVPVPEGWTVETTPDYGLLSRDDLRAYVAAVDSSTAETAVDTVLAGIGLELPGESVSSTELPLPNGTWNQQVYVQPDGGIDVVLTLPEAERVYVIVMRAPSTDALTAAQPEINSIVLSFETAGAIDLTGVAPMALDEAALDDLDAYIQSALEEYEISGASVAVVQNGEVIFSKGYGLTQADGRPVDEETLFMIGSVTKSMTTMLAASLVDDGVWSWDQPVVEVLPSFTLSEPGAAEDIRVRDLFNMSSGLPRYDVPLVIDVPNAAEIIEWLAEIPMASAPGDAYHYSNFMVAAGGFLAGLASGAEYGPGLYDAYIDLMQTRVFEPIGMTSTTFDLDAASLGSNTAASHTLDPESSTFVFTPLEYERWATRIAPAGSVWSNAADMARYLQTVMAEGVAPDGTRVVSAENLLETQTPAVSAGLGEYAMGWTVGDFHGLTQVYHGGNTTGFSSNLAFLPEADLGVVVLANRMLATSFTDSVTAYVFELAYGLEHTAGDRFQAMEALIVGAIDDLIADTPLTPVDAEETEPYVGDYERGVRATFDEMNGFMLITEAGAFPMADIDGQEGAYALGQGGMGYGVRFEDDRLTIFSLLTPITGEVQELTLERVG